jgi:protein-tyrosine kinase
VKIYDALQARNKPRPVGSATLSQRSADQPRPVGSATPSPRSAGGVHEVRLRPEELLRTYQTAAAMLPEGASPIIQLISATPGEGTSTIARELAVAVAEGTGTRVLLLRVTATRGRSSEADDGPVLETVLRGDLGVDKIKLKSDDAPLFVASLSANSLAGQDGSASLRGLLGHLMSLVDVVIIDAPPALADFGGLAMVGLVGGVILVVEAEHTRSPIVKEAKRLIEANGGKILGVILNKRHRYIPRIIYKWL